MGFQRRCVVVTVVALLSATLAGCGSRLTPAQRAAAIGQQVGQEGSNGSASGVGPEASVGPQPSASSGGSGSRAAGRDAPSAKCGGRGGATDTGVRADKITIANVSDVSGPVPGLFESAQQAVKAYAAYINATGSVCGRKLEVISLDSHTDSGGDQQATLQACRQAFAMVGSMSAFDQGGAKDAAKCGIPDLRATTVTSQRQRTSVSFGAASNVVNLVQTAIPETLRARNPQAAKKAAFLYLNSDVTRQNSQSYMKAYEKHGFNWVYSQAIDVSDFNYAPYVTQMKQRGVRFVQWIGSYQYMVRLAKAMQQQGFKPDIFFSDPSAYDPGYVEQGGSAVNDTVVFTNTALFEEIGGNRELQLYRSWLQRVAPGARPNYFGMFAWGAARLFVQLATEVGPNLKREALLAKIKAVHDYTGNGLFAAQDVGGKRTSPCVTFVKLDGTRWKRLTPSRGYACRGLTETRVG